MELCNCVGKMQEKMLDAHVEPSELHWKKELTVLRKVARYLRDPETNCSWMSPLNSTSVAAVSSQNYGNRIKGSNIEPNNTVWHSELECENIQKKVSLYNWGHRSGKSSGQGTNLDEYKYAKEGSMAENPLYNLEDSQSETYFEDPFRVRKANLEMPMRRTVKKLKKGSAISKPNIERNSSNLNLGLELPSVSSGTVTSVQQSDDMDYCNSEDSWILRNNITQQYGYTSKSTSALPTGWENWSYSSKPLRDVGKDDSSYSYTPASTISCNKYGNQNPSTVGSWDGTTTSLDGDGIDHLDLPRCGIPCYWSKRRPKYGGCGGCYSPSLSETLRRKGSSILRGSRTWCHKRRLSGSKKRKILSRSSQALPLLTYNSAGRGGSSMDTGQSDDELSTNSQELDIEGLNWLDGRTWASSCKIQNGLELVPTAVGAEVGTPDHIRSLSQKYRPQSFDDLIGQSIVVHSLTDAILRGRIAPIYLFQGPRGTGKTSTARILAAALNCQANEETKPCGFCRECTDFISSKSMDVRETDATNKKGIDRVSYLLNNLPKTPVSLLSRYNVFIIKKCHLLPSKLWSAFLKFLKEPSPRVVFMFITTDIDNLPHMVLSRCQKYLFNMIKDNDIVTRLKKLSADENLDVELNALNLIALNAEGSLQDAETMLDQLTLLGKKITASLVNELVGVVSEEKLLDLLELAMSSDTTETVKRARDLTDSGVDPMALTSQLAGVIMDIIAGTYHLAYSKSSSSFFVGRSLSEAELDRLKQALKLLLEAERQLRVSNERSKWFTATLLQIGSVLSPGPIHSNSSGKQFYKKMGEAPSGVSRRASAHKMPDTLQGRKSSTSSVSRPRSLDEHYRSQGDLLSMVDASNYTKPTCSRSADFSASTTTDEDIIAGSKDCEYISQEKLDDIWEMCIDRCHAKTLRKLLHVHAKLISISEVKGVLIAFIAFEDGELKSRAERFRRSITKSIEIVMRHNVEVRMELTSDGDSSIKRKNMVKFPECSAFKENEITEKMKRKLKDGSDDSLSGHSDMELHQESFKSPKESFYGSESKLKGVPQKSNCASSVVDRCCQVRSKLPVTLAETDAGIYGIKEGNRDVPMQRIQAIIDEQRLESAWLQAAEKGTPASLNRLKPERNQVLPQDGVYHPNQMASMISMELSSQRWEDELNHKIKALRVSDGRNHLDRSSKRAEHYPVSPSLLHDRSSAANFNKENLGYESGTGSTACNGLLCWKMNKPYKKGKAKQGTPVRKGKHFLCFGKCGKARRIRQRFKT